MNNIANNNIDNTRSNVDRRLYLFGAMAAVIVAFSGFAHSYYLKGVFGTPSLTGLVHLHGMVMTLWVLTFVVQTTLVATGNTVVHRRLGIFGAVLAALVIIVGPITAITAARLGHTPGPPPLVFLAIPLVDILVFAILVSTGLLMRRRSDYHKRLMLLSTLGILTAAIARIPLDVIKAGGLPLFFGLTDLLVLSCVTFDTIKNRRLHPAFGWGALLIIASQAGRFLMAGTPQWARFAAWLIS